MLYVKIQYWCEEKSFNFAVTGFLLFGLTIIFMNNWENLARLVSWVALLFLLIFFLLTIGSKKNILCLMDKIKKSIRDYPEEKDVLEKLLGEANELSDYGEINKKYSTILDFVEKVHAKRRRIREIKEEIEELNIEGRLKKLKAELQKLENEK